MISSNNIKNILNTLFTKSRAVTDAQYIDLNTNMNKGWISSGTIEDIQGSKTTNDTPVGSIIAHMGNTAPTHYLICDGSTYNIEDYSELANFFLSEFGKVNYFGGDGTTTFAVPNLKGEFLRGTGTNSHTYGGSGSSVGTHQEATTNPWVFADSANITVTGNYGNADWNGVYTTGDVYKYVGANNYSSGVKRRYTVRPTNTSVLYCIKYESTKLLSINLYDSCHYSEDEEIIGQWIDGKPLYRKVIPFTFPSTSGITQYTDALPDEMEFLVSLRGKSSGVNAYDSTMDVFRDFPFYLSASDYVSIYVNFRTINLYVASDVVNWNKNNSACFIAEYTKSTDTAFDTDEDIAWTALDSEVTDVINNISED